MQNGYQNGDDSIFRRRGACGQFNELLEGNSKLEAWYEYEDAEEKRKLRAYCEVGGLEIEEQPSQLVVDSWLCGFACKKKAG